VRLFFKIFTLSCLFLTFFSFSNESSQNTALTQKIDSLSALDLPQLEGALKELADSINKSEFFEKISYESWLGDGASVARVLSLVIYLDSHPSKITDETLKMLSNLKGQKEEIKKRISLLNERIVADF
jgi:hypothetical protein